jgi:hydroxyethylthiazole kinase-like uncharacterized protein yjeF
MNDSILQNPPIQTTPNIDSTLKSLRFPDPNSHKGQNGKLLIIGGSELFHAASKWSLDVASKFVDMVFYSSVPTNNQLIREAKGNFWNGIVVPREDLESYLEEADCVLIGPGMTRSLDTATTTNHLVSTFADKKWVIDAGALQMIDPKYISENMIITPHHQELTLLKHNGFVTPHRCVQILKGVKDVVTQGEMTLTIEGGNGGMTKGGTGDVLAGLVAALYCKNDAWTAAVAGSYFNKQAGDWLYQTVGPFFNSSDLVTAIPQVMWHYYQAH